MEKYYMRKFNKFADFIVEYLMKLKVILVK